MIYDYLKSLDWNVMQSRIWSEIVRACAMISDDVFPDIRAVRDYYSPWEKPDDFAISRGIYPLPFETVTSYRNRIIDAYSFWQKIHNPEYIKILIDGEIQEYAGDIWAEYAFKFNNNELTTEEVVQFINFLNQVKPARSRLKGVYFMSDTFFVSKDHRHTGGDDGAVINHSSLLEKGEKTHAELDAQVTGLEESIRYLRLMDQCKRSDIRELGVQFAANTWGDLVKIKLSKADIPAAANTNTSGVFGLCIFSATVDYCSAISLALNIDGEDVKEYTWNSPDSTRQVFAHYSCECIFDTVITLRGKTTDDAGLFKRASLIFIPGGWRAGL